MSGKPGKFSFSRCVSAERADSWPSAAIAPCSQECSAALARVAGGTAWCMAVSSWRGRRPRYGSTVGKAGSRRSDLAQAGVIPRRHRGNGCCLGGGAALLARRPQVPRRHRGRAAEWIDVQSAAAGIARVDAEFAGRTAPHEVDEHALHTVLVELAVLAEGDDVAQQAGAVDRRTHIVNLHAAPVRLA